MFSWVSAAVLAWLKIMSFCITSLLALLGLLYDFKEKETGNLTKWGRINLCGLILAFVVGILAQKIEDDRKQVADTANDTKMKLIVDGNNTIVAKNNTALGNLQTVITANNQLIAAAQETLKAEKKTDADTQHALRDVNRGMDLVGETITVGYDIVVQLEDGVDLEFLRRTLQALEEKHTSSLSFYGWRGENTMISPHGKSDALVMFGSTSPIIPDGLMREILARPPFEIWIQDEKPDIHPMAHVGRSSKEQKPSGGVRVNYVYDAGETEKGTSKSSDSPIEGATAMTFVSSGKNILMSPYTENVFRRASIGALLSAVDFGGKYLVISKTLNVPYTFCSVSLKIGKRTLLIPLDTAERDDFREYIYKMPLSMSQTQTELLQSRAAENRCIESQIDLSP